LFGSRQTFPVLVFFFLDDPTGDYVVNLGPRGFSTPVDVVDTGLIRYPIIRPSTQIYRNFFPSVLDFTNYYAVCPSSLTKWSSSNVFRPIDGDVKYQARASVGMKERIVGILASHHIMDYCGGLRPYEILRECLPLENMNMLSILLTNDNSFCRLNDGDLKNSFWCLKSNMNFLIPEGKYSLSGSVSSLLSIIDEQRVTEFTFDPQKDFHKAFILFLTYNLYYVRLNIELYPAVVRIKKM